MSVTFERILIIKVKGTFERLRSVETSLRRENISGRRFTMDWNKDEDLVLLIRADGQELEVVRRVLTQEGYEVPPIPQA